MYCIYILEKALGELTLDETLGELTLDETLVELTLDETLVELTLDETLVESTLYICNIGYIHFDPFDFVHFCINIPIHLKRLLCIKNKTCQFAHIH